MLLSNAEIHWHECIEGDQGWWGVVGGQLNVHGHMILIRVGQARRSWNDSGGFEEEVN
jgi:hypothetical protein